MDDNDPALDRVKEVKVRIPVAYHIKLHSMKVLTGKPISDAVTEALTQYFSQPSVPAGPPEHVPLADLDDGLV